MGGAEALFGLGLALLAVGLWIWAPPAALIVTGVIVMWLGWQLAALEGGKPKTSSSGGTLQLVGRPAEAEIDHEEVGVLG